MRAIAAIADHNAAAEVLSPSGPFDIAVNVSVENVLRHIP